MSFVSCLGFLSPALRKTICAPLYIMTYNALQERDVHKGTVLARLCILEQLFISCGVSCAEVISNSYNSYCVCSEAFICSLLVGGRGSEHSPLCLIYMISKRIHDLWRQPAFSYTATNYNGHNRVILITGMLHNHECNAAYKRNNRLM